MLIIEILINAGFVVAFVVLEGMRRKQVRTLDYILLQQMAVVELLERNMVK